MHAQEFFCPISPSNSTMNSANGNFDIFRLYNDTISEKYCMSSSFSTKIEANGPENIIVKNLSSDFV